MPTAASSAAWSCWKNGRYSSAPIRITQEGIKRVDVAELYDTENYLPKVREVEGKPMFLY